MHVRRTWLVGLILLGCACSKSRPTEPSTASRPAEDALPRAGVDQPSPLRSAPPARDAVGTATPPARHETGTSTATPEPAVGADVAHAARGAAEAPAERQSAAAKSSSPSAAEPHGPRAPDENTVRAPFRARPGRRLVGHAALEAEGGRATLTVDVRDAPADLERIRLFRAESCEPFGVGTGRFSSLERGTPDAMNAIGDLRLADGKGRDEYALSDTKRVREPSAAASARAIVAFAPIEAHGDDVSEPIACAELPKS